MQSLLRHPCSSRSVKRLMRAVAAQSVGAGTATMVQTAVAVAARRAYLSAASALPRNTASTSVTSCHVARPSRRSFATTALPTKNLVARYEKFGPVDTVLKLKEEPISPPAAGQVMIQFLAAPINPADINMVRGDDRQRR
jgi:hypothetical protein